MPNLSMLKLCAFLLILLLTLAGGTMSHLARVRAEGEARDQAARAAAMEIELGRRAGELAEAARANAYLRKDLKLNYQALSAREVQRAALAAEKQALKTALNEVYTHDQTAKAWAATLCPGAVLDRLCGPVPVPAGSPGPSPGDLSARCPRALTNGQLLAWAVELREALRMSNQDKAALRNWARERAAADE